ncbi:MAG: hypothetical protein JNM56_26255 [Planctomycetia bacterium]|nr:hypothetical protein [Planctomycetia bacterium]
MTIDAAVPSPAPPYSAPWLFSAPIDLTVFLGSALLSLCALWLGAVLGVLDGEGTPTWTWVPAVLLIDVAHVWSTAFRVYFDPAELQRRPLLYLLTPVCAFAVGVALYAQGELLFWRTVAYLAVFHFVRQQYGWVALYRARGGERAPLGRWIDTLAIYLATVYPLLYWHAHLPRGFWWMKPGDWIVPAGSWLADAVVWLDRVVAPLYWTVLAVYALRAGYLWLVVRRPNPGKDVVVATTAVCWYVGIVWFNSDYAFTVTNVVIHGVPYFALVYWYWQRRRAAQGAPLSPARGLLIFFATVWALAYAEELLWDRGLWHEHPRLFGEGWDIGGWGRLLAPLLAVPQLTHYVLDGFIWRRRSNPEFALVEK